MVMVEASIIL